MKVLWWVGAHIEDGLVQKIEKGEYVDFGKLIPRDRVAAEEDGKNGNVCKKRKNLLEGCQFCGANQ